MDGGTVQGEGLCWREERWDPTWQVAPLAASPTLGSASSVWEEVVLTAPGTGVEERRVRWNKTCWEVLEEVNLTFRFSGASLVSVFLGECVQVSVWGAHLTPVGSMRVQGLLFFHEPHS